MEKCWHRLQNHYQCCSRKHMDYRWLVSIIAPLPTLAKVDHVVYQIKGHKECNNVRTKSCLEVIKLEYSLRLKKRAMIGCLRTSENELKVYNLEACS